MKIKILLWSSLLLVFTSFAAAMGERPREKPASPLSISIRPAANGLAADLMDTGDTIDLVVEVVSFIDAENLEVTIKPLGGVEMVFGETSWTGPIRKKSPLLLNLTVRKIKKGVGKLRARAHIALSKSASVAAQAVFKFGPEQKDKEKGPSKEKDGKQRDIIEYRLDDK